MAHTDRQTKTGRQTDIQAESSYILIVIIVVAAYLSSWRVDRRKKTEGETGCLVGFQLLTLPPLLLESFPLLTSCVVKCPHVSSLSLLNQLNKACSFIKLFIISLKWWVLLCMPRRQWHHNSTTVCTRLQVWIKEEGDNNGLCYNTIQWAFVTMQYNVAIQ